MADPDVDMERKAAFFKSDFIPQYGRETAPTPQHRIATALEYIAYHMGQIDNKLDRLMAALERE